MIRTTFNDNWTVKMEMPQHCGEAPVYKVTLPHDGMLYTKRSKNAWNGSKKGYFENGTWIYEKEFEAPVQWREQHVFLEFEGVYNQSMVYINGSFAGQNAYGYTEFCVDAGPLLKYGEKNTIKVTARTGDDSRWYSGAGIYRNVNLLVSEPLYIVANGVRITTPSIGGGGCEGDTVRHADIQIETTIHNDLVMSGITARVKNELYGPSGEQVGSVIFPATLKPGDELSLTQHIYLDHSLLWDENTPNLYTCRTTLLLEDKVMDTEETRFGIRSLCLDPLCGLQVNGKSIKLRGTCIHHDNGVIGARAIKSAEYRKVRMLKENGFNAIRMAHHPAGRALLDACDELGMYVMDETFDMWTVNKSSQDYALNFSQWWERDVEAMVKKDVNHPCVIMYSIGNEIPDLETAAGSAMSWKIADKIRSLDSTRYTTHAVNGLMTIMNRMGEVMGGIMTQMAPQESGAAQPEKSPSGTSEFSAQPESEARIYDQSGPEVADQMPTGPQQQVPDGDINAKMAQMGAVMKYVTNSPVMDAAIEQACAAVDIAGYNYMIDRYTADNDKYPERIIVGSETYPRGINQIWRLVQDNANVIGDFTWTGWDYLGEAGIGRLNYDIPDPNAISMEFYGDYPWITAWCGDCDITGYRLPASYYREIVFGLRKEPYIAVLRPDRYGQTPLISPWSWSDVISSWSFDGYEDKPMTVEVYSPSDEVELFINGKSQGRQPAGEANEFKAVFNVVYKMGTIEAIGYCKNKACGSYLLESSGKGVFLDVEAEKNTVLSDASDLAFINIRLTDEKGNLHVLKDRCIEIEVDGEGELIGFGSGAPKTEESYVDSIHTTFEGRAFAVIAPVSSGTIHVTVKAEGCAACSLSIPVVERI